MIQPTTDRELFASCIWHDAQDSEFDTGFNEAKRQALAAFDRHQPSPPAELVEEKFMKIATDAIHEILKEDEWDQVEEIAHAIYRALKGTTND